jgi:murein DD-endopeptidase MepM/ murein hydrolase activator NlpD
MNYPRPAADSGLGIHAGANCWFPLGENESKWESICSEWRQMGLSWVKVISGGNNLRSAERVIDVIVRAGLMPIVRFFQDKPYPADFSGDLLPNLNQATRFFVDHGVKYFEPDNEPNLVDEWRSWEDWHRYDAPDARPHAAADWWAAKAEQIINAGGIPLLVALAPGGHHDDEDFYPRMVRRLKDRQLDDLLRQSAIATHNYWLNHPIDFPYDAINQAEHGAVNLHSGRGMSNGFLKYRYVYEVFKETFGFGLPVLTTEGGPRITDAQDNRYPAVSLDVHRDYVLQQADHMAKHAPEWYYCTADWLYASKEFGGATMWEAAAWVSPMRNPNRAPIIDALKARGFVQRTATPQKPEPDPVIIPVPAPNVRVQILEAAWQANGVPRNPEAAFFKVAQHRGYGAPLGPERETNDHVYQAFAGGILFCRRGRWNEVECMEWYDSGRMMLTHPVAVASLRRVTQRFGERPEYYSKFVVSGVPLRGHNGLDFGLPTGSEIVACADGQVIERWNDPSGYGLYVKLRHSWGESLYAHLSQQIVSLGDTVVAGQPVGKSGNTGNSTGAHLHFSIRINPYRRDDGWGGFSDPEPYLS